jgi:multiple sugar transport system permease protein
VIEQAAATSLPSLRWRKRLSQAVARFVIYLIISVAAGTMLVPFLWMVSTSLKTPGQVFQYPPVWIPNPVKWSNYREVFSVLPFPFATAIVNSTKITVLSVFGATWSSSMAAFAFARLRFRGSGVLFPIFLGTMMIPGAVTLIPVFLLMRALHWIDTHNPLIVPAFFGNAYGMFLMRQFFLTLPRDLDDSAKIDGANPLWIYAKVYMPISKPAVATFAVLTFLGAWNDLIGPAIYLTTPSKMTMALGLAFLRGGYYTAWELVMAGAVISLIPTLALYIAAQQYFVQGMVLSGIKG